MRGDPMDAAPLPLFSADSHVVEPGHCFTDYVEAKYRDRVPRYEAQAGGGEVLIFDRYPPLRAALWHPRAIASAAPSKTMTLEEVNRGAYDPKQRLLDQDRDGVIGEVIYPTVA